MRGHMMDRPLLLKALLWRAERVFPEKEVVTRTEGGLHRYTYREHAERVRRLANALSALGVGAGDRVGTLAWNTHRHLEAYFAVPCLGAVLHTVNLRLFPDQIAHTINHAGDSVLLLDADQVERVEELGPQIPGVKAFVVLSDGEVTATRLAPLHGYEELLADASPDLDFPDFDEDTASGICYTSATTGDPKGVVFSHRGMVLHSLALGLHGSIGIREDMTMLLVTPMFHVNAWGVPHAAVMQGAKLVLPGVHPEPHHWVELIERERATHAVGAVTVGIMMRDFLEANPGRFDLSSFEVLWLGGQAPPRGLMEWFERHHGVRVVQGWGMTEASPLLTFAHVKQRLRQPQELAGDVASRQGLPLPLAEVKVAGDEGVELPWDGHSVGEFMVRAPWVASSYFEDPERTQQAFLDGWFRTGDMGTIDPDGYVRLVDRAKDLIKSGGEWISSVDLENALMAHPDVAEAAVVGAPHPKWLERPVAYLVPRDPRHPPARESLDGFLGERFARWWLPDDYVMVTEIPKTGVGKFDKKVLRRRLADEPGGASAGD